MLKKVDPKVSFPKLEEATLNYWDENKIFEKSVEKNSADKSFIFYEGPPTANGRPGLHHVLARSFKDIIPRYKTMRGFRVERKAGWDTHGLPVELQVEKALGLKNKQDIENIVPGDARASVIEFNKQCKKSVWEYRDLWEKLTHRMAYWVDMEHPYVTYENDYIESVWWQLAEIAKLKTKNGESMLYRGHKVVPYCYRCGTALSSHEVAQGYKEVTDNSVYVKFRVAPSQDIFGMIYDDINTYFLVWTTTPWTLPGNVALAINPSVTYVCLEHRDGNRYILSDDRARAIFSEQDVVKKNWIRDGKHLLEKTVAYQPLYETIGKDVDKSYRLIAGNFVTTTDGTGIVHIAPAFGEDDADVARENHLPTLLTVDAEGKVNVDVPGKGIPVKKLNDKNRYAVDDLIIKDLMTQRLLLNEEIIKHEYPFCWRCDTPLIYFAKPSWFIRMSALRDELNGSNQNVAWVPDHIKEGRFGEWLRGVKDWAISRERYWGTPIPIWNCEKCDERKVVASFAELTKLSGKTIEDVHKPYIDDVTFACTCGGTMKRTPEVMDVWFDSGAMPLAQFAYPAKATTEAKEKIESGKYFPADYICEAIDQTRGWFYTLHAIATLLRQGSKVPTGNAFKNVICLGHILDAQGKKMSKSKGNVIDPFQMFDEYGADALRWMLFSINQPGLPKRFDVKGMRDVQNRVFRMLWNSYSFFTMYATIDKWEPTAKSEPSKNLLDRWILSELAVLVQAVDADLEKYDVYAPTQKVESFIDNLSNWYIRRSRRRFWKSEDDSDKNAAYATLHEVLVTLAKVMAPFTPFIAEEIYRNLTGETSVHLAQWPVMDEKTIDEKLNDEMRKARETVRKGLQRRVDAGIKVRQPLNELSTKYNVLTDLLDIIKEEVNVKRVIVNKDQESNVVLDTEITEELKLEGEAREIIRAIQEGRKKAGFNVEDRIVLGFTGFERVFTNAELKTLIEKEVLATESKNELLPEAEYSETTTIDDESFVFTLKRNI